VEGLTLAERKALTRQMAARYQKGSKKAKGHVLDELCALTGWHRDHARKALRGAIRGPTATPSRPRRGSIYGQEVLVLLRRIWAVLDAPSGKRLAPFMAEAVQAMERAGELSLDPAVRQRLLRVSAATIDRLLAPERRRLQVNGRSGTKPGSLLRRQIPIRTFAEWDEARPGVPGGRSGGPRRRRPQGTVLPDAHPDRRGHGLDGGPGTAQQELGQTIPVAGGIPSGGEPNPMFHTKAVHTA
jgi:hypothetical protein